MRAALYARVSTADKDQNPETQMRQLREHAERKGYDVVGEYVDTASATDMRHRTAWRDLIGNPGRFDVLLVTRIDRAWRSVVMMVTDLDDLDSRGKTFHAITQPIDTTGSLGRLLLQILGSVAEFERELIRERTREGLARVRAEAAKAGVPVMIGKRGRDKGTRRPRSDKGIPRVKKGGARKRVKPLVSPP